MPAFSFQERFVPFVLDGSKPHTIRRFRKRTVFQGDILHLYYGMRTKNCKKLRQEICTKSETIAISSTGNVIIIQRPSFNALIEDKIKCLVQKPDTCIMDEIWGIPAKSLADFEKDQLAWKDGFRPEGTTIDNCAGTFKLFLPFFEKFYGLPFVGNIIHWDPTHKPERDNFGALTGLYNRFINKS